ncbi:hypothetical protein ALP29_200298 [Pseudomonas syringae pv. avii]|uniref:Uncharacterized protein n=1 Tax=Pseudomonas syringae pv. avii TaxID=663959 RepID=A0A3M5UK39_PSESX|nr:hypothetical protein ALP29_200298 [Pseudomonas syringae pv. avii]
MRLQYRPVIDMNALLPKPMIDTCRFQHLLRQAFSVRWLYSQQTVQFLSMKALLNIQISKRLTDLRGAGLMDIIIIFPFNSAVRSGVTQGRDNQRFRPQRMNIDIAGLSQIRADLDQRVVWRDL